MLNTHLSSIIIKLIIYNVLNTFVFSLFFLIRTFDEWGCKKDDAEFSVEISISRFRVSKKVALNVQLFVLHVVVGVYT